MFCSLLQNMFFALKLSQAQVGWGSEQLGPAEDVPAHCRGGGQDDLQRSLPTHTILWLYDCTWSAGLVWHLMLFLALQPAYEGETTYSLIMASLTQLHSSSVFGVYFDRLSIRHTSNVSQGLGRTIWSHHWAGLVRVSSPAHCQHMSWLSPGRAVPALGWCSAQSN